MTDAKTDPWWDERMVPTKQGAKKWFTVGVVTYHNDVRALLGPEVDVRHVWSEDEANTWREVLRERGLSEERILDVQQAVYNLRTSGYAGPPYLKPLTFREDPIEQGMDAFIVSGSAELLEKYVWRALERTVEDSTSVGGDDSYFDYFPDEVYIMGQLCAALDLKEAYTNAVWQMRHGRYEGDPEVLFSWDEIVGDTRRK